MTRTGRSGLLMLLMLPASGTAQVATELPREDRPLQAAVTPRFTIGGSKATGWDAFARIDGAAFDGHGNLYLLDRQSRHVVMVGPDGRFVREIGREGEGPGEFAAPVSLAVLPDGSSIVLDVLTRRLSLFAPHGAFVRDVAATAGAGMPRAIHAAGHAVVGDVRTFVRDGEVVTRTADGMQATGDRPIQRYPLMPEEEAQVVYRARLETPPLDERGQPYLAAFVHAFGMTALPDGRMVLSDTAAYELTIVGAGGAVERVLKRPLPDRPVTDAHRDAERKRLLADLAEGRPPAGVAITGSARPSREEVERHFRERIDAMRFPATFPHVGTLRADASGRIWVERTGTGPADAHPIDVLTPEGTYLGTLPAGAPGLPVAFGPGGAAAFVELDELDVPVVRVVTLEIERVR